MELCTYQCKARAEGRAGGYEKRGGDLCLNDPKFLSNACGLGVEKFSNKVKGPTAGTQNKSQYVHELNSCSV